MRYFYTIFAGDVIHPAQAGNSENKELKHWMESEHTATGKQYITPCEEQTNLNTPTLEQESGESWENKPTKAK